MGVLDSVFGGGDTKVKAKPDPRLKNFTYDTLDAADLVTSQPYQTYGGPRIAGYGADTQAGQAATRSNVGRWVPFVDEAMIGARGAGQPINMGDFTPDQVRAQQVQAGQLAGTDLAPYMNPWQSGVVDTTMAEIMRSRDAQMADLRRRQAGSSYGGSAGAVQAGQLDKNVNNTVAQTIAQLMSQGYTQAQAQAVADINRRMQADVSNQGATLQADLANQGMGAQAYGMNLGRLQADRAAGFQSSDMLARLGLQGQQMGNEDAARLIAIGQMEDKLKQSSLDQAFADWQAQKNHPLEMLNIRNAIGSGQQATLPSGQTTQNPGANILAQLAGLGIAGYGLFA